MYRLYLGNLATEVNEQTLESLFASEGLNASNILVKRGYAFVDCLDQAVFDKAIETFNGKNLT
jgi:RNA recognition motif-containing protein